MNNKELMRGAILNEFKLEREDQEKDGKLSQHNELEWLGILAIQLGDASRAVLIDYEAKEYRRQLIHAGAVALAAIEDYDERFQQ